MINFSKRSVQKELLDRDDIPFADIRQNMKELNTINTLLGGHSITIQGIDKIYKKQISEQISICEIGCGGGDNLSAIAHWSNRKHIQPKYIGIDIKKECIEYAKEQNPDLDVTWITNNYIDVELKDQPDIIFSSLFCHHFTNNELIKMLQWMNQKCSMGFFINDLQRHPMAFYLIKLLTRLFSRSYLVRNDAPISVTRGFKRKDWVELFEKAGISHYSIEWKWAFRYLVICKKHE